MKEGRGGRLALGAVPAAVLAVALMVPSGGADAAVGAQGAKPTSITTQCLQETKGYYGVTPVNYKCTKQISVQTTPEANGFGIGITTSNGRFRTPEIDAELVPQTLTSPVPHDKGAEVFVIQKQDGLGTSATVFIRQPK